MNVFLRAGDTAYRTYNTQGGPGDRAAQPQLPAHLRTTGGVAGLARRLARVAHLQSMAPSEAFSRYAEQP